MKTKSELTDEIFDWSSLLGIILAGPDADSAIDGMHRLALQIRANAVQLREVPNAPEVLTIVRDPD